MSLCQHMRKFADCFSCRYGKWMGDQLEVARKDARKALGHRLLNRCVSASFKIKGTPKEKTAKLAKALFAVTPERLQAAWEVLHPGATYIPGLYGKRAPIIIAYYVVHGRLP